MFLLRDLPGPDAFERFGAAYPDLDPERVGAFLRVLRAGSDLLAELDAFLATYGLAHGRWITLILLRREEGGRLTPSVLAEKQGVSRATMTRLVASLTRDGLVTRIGDPDNARQAIVELTPEGSGLLDLVMPPYYRFVADRMGGLSAEDAKKLAELLDRLIRTG